MLNTRIGFRETLEKWWAPVAFMLAVIIVAIGASTDWGHGYDPVEEAARCGEVRFSYHLGFVHASTASSAGDEQSRFIKDVENLSGFMRYSRLPPLKPGIPENWPDIYWKQTGFAEELKRDAAKAQHIEEWLGWWATEPGREERRYRQIIAVPHGERTRIYALLVC